MKIFQSIVVALLFVMSAPSYSSASEGPPQPPTAEQKKGAGDVIQKCEATYQQTKDLKKNIEAIPKPSIIHIYGSKKTAYKNKDLNLKVFHLLFGEFAESTTKAKIKVQLAPTAEKLGEATNELSSNCTRQADGIKNFVEWAVSGESSKAASSAEIINFKDLQKEVKNK